MYQNIRRNPVSFGPMQEKVQPGCRKMVGFSVKSSYRLSYIRDFGTQNKTKSKKKNVTRSHDMMNASNQIGQEMDNFNQFRNESSARTTLFRTLIIWVFVCDYIHCNNNI